MIKKILTVFMLITALLLISSCGKKENTEGGNNEEKVFSLTVDNFTFELGSEFNSDTYGETVNFSETQSCAFKGLDKTYTYEHYEITTYPKDDKDYIYSIYLLDPEIKTNEGIAIDDSKDQMLKVYGDKYTEDDGFYTYTEGQTQLRFGIQVDKIISIEYLYITE